MVVAVVLAAGRGVRLGAGRPKAQVTIAGRSLLEWSALALARARAVQAVLPVVAAGCEEQLRALRAAWSEPAKLLPELRGAETRQGSLGCALAALETDPPAWLLVHDAARCLLTPGDVDRVFEAAAESGAAIPVVPLRDTVKQVRNGRVLGTPEREGLAAAQTPQVFRFELLARAYAQARREGFEATDCASLVERLGVEVRTVAGNPGNFKVTDADDLARAQLLLGAAARAARRAGRESA